MARWRNRRTWAAWMAGRSLALGACAAPAEDESPEVQTAITGGGPALIATATLDQATDLAGLTDALEDGTPQNVLGGIGSGLTYAGGTTFLAVPDRRGGGDPAPVMANSRSTSPSSRRRTASSPPGRSPTTSPTTAPGPSARWR